MSDHLAAQLSRLGLTLEKTGTWHGVSSMSILRPLLELHRLTGSASAMALARSAVDSFSAASDSPAAILRDALRPEPIVDWHPMPTFWAKAYEIMSCLEGCADWARLTGDRAVLDAVLAYHRHLVAEELNPMGSVGHFDHFLRSAHRVNGMTELCDVVHWIRLNRELLLLTGRAEYAGRMEEAFCNAFLAGVWRDGRWGAHMVRSHGTRHLSAPPQTGMTLHQCCPDNMMRTYFDMASAAVLAGPDGAVSVAFYFDADIDAGGGAAVSVRGGYPWSDGPVVVTVRTPSPRRIRFRVPQWSRENFRVEGPGLRRGAGDRQDGWLSVEAPAGESSWTLEFDFSPRLEDFGPASDERLPPSPQEKGSVSDVGVYTVHFMEWMTPEMSGLCRTRGGATVMRGPLVLAKGRLAGTAREETLFAPTVRGGGWCAAGLLPSPHDAVNAGAASSWTLVLKRGGETRRIPVADFASVSDIDDPSNWFSLWF